MGQTNFVRALLEEPWYFPITFLIFAFLSQAFDFQLAGIYVILILAHFTFHVTQKPQYTFNAVSGNSGKAVLTAATVLGVFFLTATFLVNLFQAAAKLTFQGMVDRLGAAAFGATAPPILQSNTATIFIVGAFLIPLVETKSLIAMPLELLSKLFKVQLRLRSVSSWILFLTISALGVVFHFQAKGVIDTVALTLTFIFWLFSCVLIVWMRESESAVYLHMGNNGIALLNVLNKAKMVVGG